MTKIAEQTHFYPLPCSSTERGKPRRVGVEIECAGITEFDALQTAQIIFGGHPKQLGSFENVLVDSAIGDVRFILDTALRKRAENAILEKGLDLARAVVPVEIVTEPLCFDQLSQLEELRAALRDAGAIGTGNGFLLGFGVHFNIETVDGNEHFTNETIRAYALLEDWLRLRNPLDATRRLLPFVKPWPQSFVEALLQATRPSLANTGNLYARHVESRNHGLDLMPMLKSMNPDDFGQNYPAETATKARPAFHLRLSDCRIDEVDWRLKDEWMTWVFVEALAAKRELLTELSDAWKHRDKKTLGDRTSWAKLTAQIIGNDGERLFACPVH